MTKEQQLIQEAKGRYNAEIIDIVSLPYPEEGIDWGSNSNRYLRSTGEVALGSNFKYNKEADTLTTWGRGLNAVNEIPDWAYFYTVRLQNRGQNKMS